MHNCCTTSTVNLNKHVGIFCDYILKQRKQEINDSNTCSSYLMLAFGIFTKLTFKYLFRVF